MRELIIQHDLDVSYFNKFEIINISTPLAQLGKALFFSKALSGLNDTACATCHHPLLGGGDNVALPVGAEAVDPDIIGPDAYIRKDITVNTVVAQRFHEIHQQRLIQLNAISEYDFSLKALPGNVQHEHSYQNTMLTLSKFQLLQAQRNSKLKMVEYDESMVKDIESFLISLTDPCIKSNECMGNWINEIK